MSVARMAKFLQSCCCVYSNTAIRGESIRNNVCPLDVSGPMKAEWESNKSVIQNLEDMGLVYDPNSTFKIPSVKQLMKPGMEMEEKASSEGPRKLHVADAVEKEARVPRERTFQLPNSQVQWLTYLMNKYGEDYKAMARDHKNYEQQTWKQIRAKINRFKTIPEQFGKYLEKRRKQMGCVTVSELQ